MPTIAHPTSRLRGQGQHRLTMWLLGAALIAAVAIAMALLLAGSDGQQSNVAGDTAQPAAQEPAQWGGARP